MSRGPGRSGKGPGRRTGTPEDRQVVATNRRARYDYEVGDTWEAGLVLTGTEVKSLRQGKASLVDAYGTVDRGEAWLVNAFIPEYEQGTWTNHEPRRTRKLLLHRGEIERLAGATSEQGLTLVPLQLYFREGRAKLELGVGRGKKTYDKRHNLAARDADREMARALASARRRRG